MVSHLWSDVSFCEYDPLPFLTANRWAIGAVTGPAVGEALAQRSQWRWIFWLNLPFSIAAFGILAVFASLKARAPGSMLTQLRSYDWIGFALLTGSLVGTNIGISWVSLVSALEPCPTSR
jgi:predicted MFS family arabinose efflux permease